MSRGAWHFTLNGKWSESTKRVAAGTIIVKTAQPLGALAAYLLDPRSEDGLAAWGVCNDPPAVGFAFRVQRLAKAYPMALGAARALPEARGEPQPITEALLAGRGGGFSFGLSGAPVTSGPWIDDEHFLQVKGGQLLRVEARTGKSEPFADPEKIKMGMRVRVVYELAPRKDREGNEYMTFYLRPAN